MLIAELVVAGPETDALVAEKIMGWHKGDTRWFTNTEMSTSEMRYDRWTPSTDIAAAWQVVERLTALGCDDFGLTWSHHNHENFMFAMNAPRHLSGSPSIGMPDPVACSGDTAPLAICRAALRVLW